MSRTRIIAITLLTFIIIMTGGWVACRVLIPPSPASQLATAKQAVARGGHQAAQIELMDLLSDHPDNGQAHLLLSEVTLAQAKQDGRLDTYVGNKVAREHLCQAARLLPEDIELQKRLLAIHLDRGEMESATEFAEAVAKSEPNHPDALLALAAKAIDAKDHRSAALYLERLASVPSHRTFESAEYALRVYGGERYANERAQVLANVVDIAANASPEQLGTMDPREQSMMREVIRVAVAEAEDAEIAHNRTMVAFEVCRKFRNSSDRDPVALGRSIAALMSELRTKHPLNGKVAAAVPARRALQQRAVEIFDEAIQTRNAPLAVYAEAALASLDLLQHENAHGLLRVAIAKFHGREDTSEQALLLLNLLEAQNLIAMGRYGETTPHIEAMRSSSDSTFVGWGELLAGDIASRESRHQTALTHFVIAERKLGVTPLLTIAIAQTLVELEKWDRALNRLAELEDLLASASPEQRVWLRKHQLSEKDVRWEQLRANLALDNWDEAQRHLDKLRGTPRETDAILAVAQYFLNKDQHSQALSFLAIHRERLPENLKLLQAHAALLKQVGDDAEVAELIEQLGARDDLASQLLLARWRFSAGEQGAAITLLEGLEKKFPQAASPRFLKARMLLAMGESSEALSIASELRESPHTEAAADLLSLVESLEERDITAASAHMKRIENAALNVTPSMDILAGMIALKQGQLAESLQRAGNNLDVKGLQRPARTLLQQSLLTMAAREGPHKAAAALAPLLARHPKDAELRLVEANLHFQNGRFGDGMRALNLMEKLTPNLPNGAYLKAEAWTHAGKLSRAQKEVTRALRIDDQFTPAIVLAAQLYLATNQPERVAELTAGGLAANPRVEQLYLLHAEAIRQDDGREAAIEFLREAFASDGQMLAVYRGLLSQLLADDRADEALVVCRQARAERSEQILFATDEIAILCRQQQLDAAQQVAREAVNNPPDADRCLSVAKTFASADLPTIATEWAERARDFGDDSLQPAIHQFMGDLALREGQRHGDQQQLEAARDHYAEVLKSNPRHQAAGNNLAWLLVTEFDQLDEALRIIERVRGDASVRELRPGFVDTIALALRRAGRLEEARQVLDESLKWHPDDGRLMLHLGMILAEADQSAAAAETLEKALQLGGQDDRQRAEATQTLASLKAASAG